MQQDYRIPGQSQTVTWVANRDAAVSGNYGVFGLQENGTSGRLHWKLLVWYVNGQDPQILKLQAAASLSSSVSSVSITDLYVLLMITDGNTYRVGVSLGN